MAFREQRQFTAQELRDALGEAKLAELPRLVERMLRQAPTRESAAAQPERERQAERQPRRNAR